MTEDPTRDTNQDAERIDAILGKIFERDPGEQVAALEAACRENPGLAAQLRGAFGNIRSIESSSVYGNLDLGDWVGPYKILDVLGEGGMGTVYLAEQKDPVRRRVALKVIKLGMDSKQVVARFEAERQALAMMEHGNISRIFDCGLTDRGLPYFAMEYVKGRPINKYCDDNKCDLRERLDLFLQVCAGVQHAHNKGVIHRDLTPNNVLVTVQDGKARIKIIDFGLARATDHRLTEATIYTEHGRILGTPEYMSPEQAGLQDLDIDTRTDVYTLGVLLYELLVGALPFSSQELRKGGLMEIQRIIREQEPAKPSTKLTTAISETATAAAARQLADVGSLAKRLRGDLDWIVMRALEKSPIRRYETASEFAADIRRHLNDEPVDAGPPSTTYRLWKLLRKHRGLATAAAAVFVALAIGLVAALWQAGIAGENETRAVSNEVRARESEDKAVKLAGQRKAEAMANASSTAIDTSPEIALLLAREAFGLEESYQTRSALHAAYLAAHDYTKLEGHTLGCRGVACSPDGKRFATSSNDGTVRLWSRDGEAEGPVLKADPGKHKNWIIDVAFVSDTEVVGASHDGNVYLWNLNGEVLHRFPHQDEHPEAEVQSVAARDDWILTGDELGVVRLWRASTRQLAKRFGHRDDDVGPKRAKQPTERRQHRITAVDLNPAPAGRPHAFAASVSLNGTIRLWSEDGGSTLLPGPKVSIYGVAFSSDGRFLARAGPGVIVYDLETGVHRRIPVRGGAWSARFTPAKMWGREQQWIVTTSSDMAVRLFTLDGKQIGVFRGHTDQVFDALFTHDGEHVLSTSFDKTARLWSLHRRFVPTLRGHTDFVRGAGFTPDSRGYLTASRDGTVREWGPRGQARKPLRAASEDLPNMRRVVKTASGRVFACSDQTGVVWWDRNGDEEGRISEPGLRTRGFAVSPNERWLAVANHPFFALYPFANGKVGEPTHKVEFPNGKGHKFHTSFSPDGKRLAAVGAFTGRVDQWSVPGAERLPFVIAHDQGVQTYVANFDKDSRRIITSHGNGHVYIWAPRADGTAEQTFKFLHVGSATHAAFAPDSDRFFTTCRDGIARLWHWDDESQDWEPFMEFRGHRDLIWRGAWSPDGRRIITASFDYTAQIWIADIEELERLVDLRLRDDLEFRERDLERFRYLLGDERIKEVAKGK